jgi:hypothetical protein
MDDGIINLVIQKLRQLTGNSNDVLLDCYEVYAALPQLDPVVINDVLIILKNKGQIRPTNAPSYQGDTQIKNFRTNFS